VVYNGNLSQLLSIHRNTVALLIIVINIAWYIVNCCCLEHRVSYPPLTSADLHVYNTKKNTK